MPTRKANAKKIKELFLANAHSREYEEHLHYISGNFYYITAELKNLGLNEPN